MVLYYFNHTQIGYAYVHPSYPSYFPLNLSYWILRSLRIMILSPLHYKTVQSFILYGILTGRPIPKG